MLNETHEVTRDEHENSADVAGLYNPSKIKAHNPAITDDEVLLGSGSRHANMSVDQVKTIAESVASGAEVTLPLSMYWPRDLRLIQDHISKVSNGDCVYDTESQNMFIGRNISAGTSQVFQLKMSAGAGGIDFAGKLVLKFYKESGDNERLISIEYDAALQTMSVVDSDHTVIGTPVPVLKDETVALSVEKWNGKFRVAIKTAANGNGAYFSSSQSSDENTTYYFHDTLQFDQEFNGAMTVTYVWFKENYTVPLFFDYNFLGDKAAKHPPIYKPFSVGSDQSVLFSEADIQKLANDTVIEKGYKPELSSFWPSNTKFNNSDRFNRTKPEYTLETDSFFTIPMIPTKQKTFFQIKAGGVAQETFAGEASISIIDQTSGVVALKLTLNASTRYMSFYKADGTKIGEHYLYFGKIHTLEIEHITNAYSVTLRRSDLSDSVFTSDALFPNPTGYSLVDSAGLDGGASVSLSFEFAWFEASLMEPVVTTASAIGDVTGKLPPTYTGAMASNEIASFSQEKILAIAALLGGGPEVLKDWTTLVLTGTVPARLAEDLPLASLDGIAVDWRATAGNGSGSFTTIRLEPRLLGGGSTSSFKTRTTRRLADNGAESNDLNHYGYLVPYGVAGDIHEAKGLISFKSGPSSAPSYAVAFDAESYSIGGPQGTMNYTTAKAIGIAQHSTDDIKELWLVDQFASLTSFEYRIIRKPN